MNHKPWIEIESLAHYYRESANVLEAYRLYRKALDLGSKTAYFYLGHMTLKGDGCLEDMQEGVNYFLKGAKAGDGRCCAELSLFYFEKSSFQEEGKKYLLVGARDKEDAPVSC